MSVTKTQETDGIRLGELCQISVGITTLSDSLYLFSILEEDGDLVKVTSKNGTSVWIEKAILKPIIKGSKLKQSTDPITEYILFPYEKNVEDKHKIIKEERLKTDYPNAYAYLKTVKGELDKRDNGKTNPVAWYAFGRAQGLDSSFGKKDYFFTDESFS